MVKLRVCNLSGTFEIQTSVLMNKICQIQVYQTFLTIILMQFPIDKNEASLMSRVHFEESSEDEDEDDEEEDEETQKNGVEPEDDEPGMAFL